ncbi:MAG TPA: hypothetical protein VHE10_02390 [Candidatus Paceibacterota bacterium]|nr:hypothetical protein [Candidatus Paceibacterota bacterium]
MKTAIITIVAALIIGGGIWAYYATTRPSNTQEQVFCTMDAKLCPDGSSVGRTGPNCEFAQCPGAASGTSANGSVNVY